MTISKWIAGLPIALLVAVSTAALAGGPSLTVHSASISLKVDTQASLGSQIQNGSLDTKGLINILLGNSVNDQIANNLKLVLIVPCNSDGDLTPMFITVWDTANSGGVAAGAAYLQFDSDFTLVERNKDGNLKKASTYAWQFDEGGLFGEYEEMQGAFSSTFRQLPKQFESGSICVSGVKSSAFTGEVIVDNEFGQNWAIKGGRLSASKPIAVLSVFPLPPP